MKLEFLSSIDISGITATKLNSTTICENGVSLINKYATISSVITGATNGLQTNSNKRIGLGGTLTGNTTIGVSGNCFIICGAPTNNYICINDSATRGITVRSDCNTIIESCCNTNISNSNYCIAFTPNAAIFYDNSITPSGLTYNADYSVYYVPRSLVDKEYVDTVATGLNVHTAVFLATTTAITLSGNQTIDGIATTNGMRVLVKNQGVGTTGSTANGIYIASASTWTRAADYDNSPFGEITNGDLIPVTSGSTQNSSIWVLTTQNPIIINVTPLLFSQFSTIIDVQAGNGIDVVMNGGVHTISVQLASNCGLTFCGTGLAINPNIAGSCLSYLNGVISVCASCFLGATACAADSAKLNNKLPSYYLNTGSTACNSLALCGCVPSCFLGATACAADSAKLNNQSASYYAPIDSPNFTTCIKTPIMCSTGVVKGTILTGSTCVTSPVIFGSICLNSPLYSGACMLATTCMCSPVVIGSTCISTPIVISTTNLALCGGNTCNICLMTNSACVLTGFASSGTSLFYSGTEKFRTLNDGACIFGNVCAICFVGILCGCATTAGNALALCGCVPSCFLGATACAADSAKLGTRLPAYYLNTGSTVTASITQSLCVSDTRNVTTTPETLASRCVVFDFKSNTCENLSDGGTFHGQMTFRQYGNATDWTGGASHQLGFTDNGNLWHRWGTSTTWGTWYKFYHTGASPVIPNNATINSTAYLTAPTLGSPCGVLLLGSCNTLYGMAIGIGPNGDTWLQSQRFDGVTSVYNILMQPCGGNVGIGTTSPLANLDIRGTAILLARNGYAAYKQFIDNNGYLNFGVDLNVGDTARMTIRQDNGNVGIGTTSPSEKLSVAGSVVATSFNDENYTRILNPGGGTCITKINLCTGAIKIKLPTAAHDNSTMMRFTVKTYQYTTGKINEIVIAGYNYSGGGWHNVSATNITDCGDNFCIRWGDDGASDVIWIGELASTWYYPQVFVTDFEAGYNEYGAAWANNWAVSFVSSFDSVEVACMASKAFMSRDGNLVLGSGCGTATDWIATSDIRTKTGIQPISNALSIITQLQGVCYCGCNDTKCEINLGLIAQDVEKILPEIVVRTMPTTEDIKYGISDQKLGLKYDKLSPVIIEAIKELDLKINCLSDELYCLKNHYRNFNI